LTIVTVVKDDPTGFQQTLESLMAQDQTGVQHVVIDSSQDRDEIPAAMTRAGSAAEWFWVPATGVYAAMNTGLSNANGTYVYFLNAGDWLYAPNTVSLLRTQLHEHQPVWAFGPVEIHSQNGTRTLTPSWNYEREKAMGLSRGHFPAHQGTVVQRTTVAELGGFDTSYRIAADYAMALRLTTISKPVQFDFPIACFAEGGVSTVEWKRSIREFHRARVRIWAPTGIAAWRERWDTAAHFTRMWVARDLLGRGKR